MSRRSTTVWAIGAVVVAGAGVAVAAVAVQGAPHAPTAGASSSASAGPGVTTGPPAASPTASAAPADPSPSATAPGAGAPGGSAPAATTPPATTVRTVSPAMSYYSFAGRTLTLGGGVSGLVDSGGTCTVTLTRGTATVTKSFAASPGPSSTDCGAMTVSSPTLTSGSWSLTIAYSSPRARGTSSPTEVTL